MNFLECFFLTEINCIRLKKHCVESLICRFECFYFFSTDAINDLNESNKQSSFKKNLKKETSLKKLEPCFFITRLSLSKNFKIYFVCQVWKNKKLKLILVVPHRIISKMRINSLAYFLKKIVRYHIVKLVDQSYKTSNAKEGLKNGYE